MVIRMVLLSVGLPHVLTLSSTGENLVIYGVYIFLVLGISALIRYRYENRMVNTIIEDFFKYVGKGQKRILKFEDHIEAFVISQFLYAPLIFSISFLIYLPVSIAVFYVYVLYADKVKQHRHNGIRIGYEYPHPANIKEETSLITPQGKEKKTIKVVEAGSKGIYDLQLKSEPNPHVIVLGSSGSGKSTTVETFLLGVQKRYKIPFLIIDWSGSYKNFDGYLNVWRVPKNLKVNPLQLRGKSPDRRAGIASEVLQMSRYDPQISISFSGLCLRI